MSFTESFVWGAATASYQIEGAWNEQGKGPSVWDRFSHWPGKVKYGDNGDTACDHVHHLEEDLDLMAEMGLQAYRFSFSWPRILPAGTGTVNEAGLAFYDRLIDGLLERNIQPWATLFHWDYPVALYEQGGWLHPQSPEWFAAYTRILAERFGDRISNWITLNEPQIFMGMGHCSGDHAPGLKLPPADITRILHHVLLSHGRAAQTLREHAALPASIGWAPAVGVSMVDPEMEQDADVVDAARSAQFDVDIHGNTAMGSSVWCDPVFLKTYPAAFLDAFGACLPTSWEDDLDTIATPIDFCGQNIYAAWGGFTRKEGKITTVTYAEAPNGGPRTLFGWPVTPGALYWGPRWFHERYDIPIVITENGLSGHDWVHLDGKVHDPHRIDFTTRYLRELKRAAADGIPVQGYFHWSLMDNFEWAEGYTHRFGLIHVDMNTKVRTPKESSKWYRTVIESNGEDL